MDNAPSNDKLSLDFWKLWSGQTLSALGSSFTGFALPLLVYNLTGSAVNLAIATAAFFVPYLLFGLVIGAWADRADRKRLMIAADIIRGLTVGSVPVLAHFDSLSVWWIYAVLFINSTVGIAFDAAKFAAVPSLVTRDDLVTANGRIQASYSSASVIGPLMGGALLVVMPLYDVIFLDALSYLFSVSSLLLIRKSFNAPGKHRGKSIRHDIAEGLRYVWGHPVLRNISIMMALVNFAATTIHAQRVLFAKERLGADDAQVALMAAAGSVGVVVLSLIAGKLRKRYAFSKVALGALMLSGVFTIVLAFTPVFWLSLPVWAAISGLGILFNLNTNSLRQAIAPPEMLGRVMTIAGVLAWSANPVGAFVGGWAIEQTQNVVLVFAVIGVLVVLIPALFALTPLGRAEDYLPKAAPQPEPEIAAQTPQPEATQDLTPRRATSG